MDLIGILVSLVITVVVLGILYLILRAIVAEISPPGPWQKILNLIFLLICLLVFLRLFGLIGGGPWYIVHTGAR